MTKRSKRELKQILDELGPREQQETFDVVFRDTHGTLVDGDGEPTEPDPDADQVIVIERSLVMFREQAIEEGRTIHGPAENAPERNDVVRVSEYDDVDTEPP